jgi:hypothetical protein
MIRFGKIAALILLAGLFYVSPAHAQATRTWVSGVGDDVNPCSRTAPCKTFAGAISKTAAGGEINCLDPGGFGAVTIIKSMTISCQYTEGGALAGGNGIVLNMPAATDVAFIRGLDIFGVNPPTNGIRFINQGSLYVENCTIRRFNAASSQGISFQPSGASNLYISDSTIGDNGNGGTGGGILIQPTSAGGAKVVMNHVRVENNANNAMLVNTTGNTSASGVSITVNDSVFAGSTGGVAVITAVGNSPINMMMTDSMITQNSGIGLGVSGPSGTVRVGNTTITANGTGVFIAGGSTVTSFGTNRLFGNPSVGAPNNGTFTGGIQAQN